MKPQDVSQVHKLLNSFYKNLQFTVGLFENIIHHFLDLEMSLDGILIYRKDNYTGLYVNYITFVPWSHHTIRINSLVTPASKICSAKESFTRVKGCICYIFASLFWKSKIENLWNKVKCFLFHSKSSFHLWDNQNLTFQIFKCHDVIKCLSMKHETHFTWEVNKSGNEIWPVYVTL